MTDNETRETHITRMNEEKLELQERLRKLDEFVKGDKFSSFNKFQKYLLGEQRMAMQRYLDVLTTRIMSDTFVMNSSLTAKVEDTVVESSEHN